jgi:hypothetical protein
MRMHQIKGYFGFRDRALCLCMDWRIGRSHKVRPFRQHHIGKRSRRRHYGHIASGAVHCAKLSDYVRL